MRDTCAMNVRKRISSSFLFVYLPLCLKKQSQTSSENRDVLQTQRTPARLQLRAGEVFHIRCTDNGAVLISAGADGCLAIWEVISREKAAQCRTGVARSGEQTERNGNATLTKGLEESASAEEGAEVLVDEKYLQEIERQLLESSRQIEDLTAQTAFKIRNLESQQQEALRQMEEKCEDQLAQERSGIVFFNCDKNLFQLHSNLSSTSPLRAEASLTSSARRS